MGNSPGSPLSRTASLRSDDSIRNASEAFESDVMVELLLRSQDQEDLEVYSTTIESLHVS